jgi:putative flippase GtrA
LSVNDAVLPQFLRFGFVGVIGFFVDVGVLYLMLSVLGTGPYSGRALSYLAAASCTWYLNRRITFASRRGTAVAREWFRFVLVNAGGGIVNYITYVLVLHWIGYAGVAPAIAVGAGSLAGLSINFALSRLLVFRRPHAAAAVSR